MCACWSAPLLLLCGLLLPAFRARRRPTTQTHTLHRRYRPHRCPETLHQFRRTRTPPDTQSFPCKHRASRGCSRGHRCRCAQQLRSIGEPPLRLTVNPGEGEASSLFLLTNWCGTCAGMRSRSSAFDTHVAAKHTTRSTDRISISAAAFEARLSGGVNRCHSFSTMPNGACLRLQRLVSTAVGAYQGY